MIAHVKRMERGGGLSGTSGDHQHDRHRPLENVNARLFACCVWLWLWLWLLPLWPWVCARAPSCRVTPPPCVCASHPLFLPPLRQVCV